MFQQALHSYERHFLFSKKFVSFVLGVLPCINTTKRSFFFFIIFICILPLLFQLFYQLFSNNFKLEIKIKLLQKILFALCFLSAYLFLYLYFEKRTLIHDHIKEDYELVTDNEELNIIEKYTKESKYYVLCVIVFCNSYIIILTFPSIIKIISYHLGIFDDVRLTLPLSLSNAFDLGLQYYCLLIYQITVLYTVITITIILISTHLVFIQHASSQFSIILKKIRRPFINDHYNNKKLYDECDWIIDIITRYKRVTEFIDLYNDMSEKTLMITVFFMMLYIILNFFCIFQLSDDWRQLSENIELIVVVVFSISVIYIYFYVGQKLLDHSIITFEELRQVPFYVLSVKTQKLYLFLIAKSMKPCCISIGGLYTFTNQVFATLLQKAFSFATVFYSMR